MYAERWAKIELKSQNIVYSTLKPNEINRCLKIFQENSAFFEEKWNEWFSNG
ncbi:hypothetical protein [Desulfonatronum lacustre]|jgi:hypothetical protein|uniref:hypothetical protein n=1 Tax=Desulfonatronum lacustre TaxID=66849 RepID=UPI0004B596DF